ncbi:fhkD [Symbiodinium natans]|uniref:FhkD protein n=1 Tax=Symbiodinium natans TaxID=878477 RepID=A0A812MBV0_9DINO|nr:fhkD [Symbiodinium natans]
MEGERAAFKAKAAQRTRHAQAVASLGWGPRLVERLFTDRSEYTTWRVHRAARRFVRAAVPFTFMCILMTSLYFLDGNMMPTRYLLSCSVTAAQFLVTLQIARRWIYGTSRSIFIQLALFTFQEILLAATAASMVSDSSPHLYYMSTALPWLFLFAVLGHMQIGWLLAVVCPVHFGCWLAFHSACTGLSAHCVALGIIQCAGAVVTHLAMEDGELEYFRALSALASEQQHMESMHTAFRGMVSSLFDASCICTEDGQVHCWSQSAPQNAELDWATASLVSADNLLDLTSSVTESMQISDFLQKLSVKALASAERAGSVSIRLKRSTVEVQLFGFKVPARSSRLKSTPDIGSVEGRLLIGVKLTAALESRTSSKGRASLDSPKNSSRKSLDISRGMGRQVSGPPAPVGGGIGRQVTPLPPADTEVQAALASSPQKTLRLSPSFLDAMADDELEETVPIRSNSKSKSSHGESSSSKVLLRTRSDTDGLADDEQGRASPKRTAQRAGGVASRLHQRAKVHGMKLLKMDCDKVVAETTETFVDAAEKYDVLEQIGRGSAAVVKKAVRKQDGLVVALKIAGSKDTFALAEGEYRMLQSIKHPHIIRALDFFTTSVSAIMVLEYFEGGSLEEAVPKLAGSRLPELKARQLFKALLSAVCYLHLRRIIHRDVKPSNVVVSADLSDLRLLDFNVAKRLTEGGALTLTGTRLYCAPEVLDGEPPNEANDVWGCGLCVYFMLAGRLPWKFLPTENRNENIYTTPPALRVTSSKCLPLSEPCKSVLRQCLTVDPVWRPAATTIMLHEWFWIRCEEPQAGPPLRGTS